MRWWERKRNFELAELLASTYILVTVIFVMAVFAALETVLKFSIYDLSVGNWVRLMLAFMGLLAVMLLGFWRLQQQRLELGRGAGSLDYLLLVLMTGVAFGIILWTGAERSRAKCILLLPPLVAAIAHGRRPGIVGSVLAAGSLLSLDVIREWGTYPSRILEADILLAAVLFLLSWLLGGLANIEEELQERLGKMADEDDVTGFFNHRRFHEELDRLFQQAVQEQSSLALLLVDVDDFRYYNNAHGHRKGDEVLNLMGEIMRKKLPEKYCAARYVGGQFAVLLPGMTSRESFYLADKLRGAIKTHQFPEAETQPTGRFTVSVGVACFPEHVAEKTELIWAAEQALYTAKFTGKDKACLYFSVLDEVAAAMEEEERDRFLWIRSMLKTVGSRDRYTYGHSERVAFYAGHFGYRLGLNGDSIRNIQLGSMLHDIGKIEIPREILNKLGKLTDEDWDILKKHPSWGAEIVEGISPLMADVIPIIRHHHENYDGTGYPSGLAGENIPLSARLLRIVDSFDAMTTTRAYRGGLTIGQAIDELRKGSGREYDPNLVREFIKMLEEDQWLVEGKI